MAQRKEVSYRSSDKITQIRALMWTPEEGTEPKAILQIVHGMQEFIDRYDGFASWMADRGFVVVGNDMLGHGGSVRNGDKRYWGYFGHGALPDDKAGNGGYDGSPLEDAKSGHRTLINDIRHLQMMTVEKYPELPCFMLGHSMGSFLAREFLCVHGTSLKAAVISGTAFHPTAETNVAKTLTKLTAQTHTWFYRSPMLDRMSSGGMNKEIEPARTRADWLTRDEKVVDEYVADERTGFRFTCNGYYTLFDCLHYISLAENLSRVPKNLPMFFIAGAQDPVGKDGDGPKRVAAQMQGLGCTAVTAKIYPQCRHEVLNELNRAEVWDDVLKFLEGCMPEK